MTPKENLRTFGWTNRTLARATGWEETTIRRFLAGAPPKPELAAWLGRAAAWITKNPPPQRK